MAPPYQQLHHAAAPARSAWDSDNVVYVGMEYSNMGACSQKAPASFHPSSNGGGCSQTKKNSFNATFAGRNLGESTARPLTVQKPVPMSSSVHAP